MMALGTLVDALGTSGWSSNPAARITAPAKPACWVQVAVMVGAVGRRGRVQVGSSGLHGIASVGHQLARRTKRCDGLIGE